MMTLQEEDEAVPLMEQAEELAREKEYPKIHVRVDEEGSEAGTNPFELHRKTHLHFL